AAQHFYEVLSVEPYREGAHRGLMRYFAAQRELGRAIDQFQTLTRRLDQELGTTPSPETLELFQRLSTVVAPAEEQTSTASYHTLQERNMRWKARPSAARGGASHQTLPRDMSWRLERDARVLYSGLVLRAHIHYGPSGRMSAPPCRCSNTNTPRRRP